MNGRTTLLALIIALLMAKWASGITGARAGNVAPANAEFSAVSTEKQPTGWISWNGGNFFGPCQGDCSVALFGGKEIISSMEGIFFVKYPVIPAWDWRWGNAEILAATFSRRLVTFWNALNIEPEVGVGQRFGDMKAEELWGAAVIRWTAFPWNNHLKTTIGLSEGVSIATEVDRKERALNNISYTASGPTKTGSILLNYFSPEITFALPKHDAYELLLRFQHRSGIFGAVNRVHAGAQFGTVGLRVHF
jgi:hypothetical protein